MWETQHISQDNGIPKHYHELHKRNGTGQINGSMYLPQMCYGKIQLLIRLVLDIRMNHTYICQFKINPNTHKSTILLSKDFRLWIHLASHVKLVLFY